MGTRLSINDVVILTPAVVTVAISDGSNDDQSITTSVRYPLVLDKRFTIATSALGSFNGLPGYGCLLYTSMVHERSRKNWLIAGNRYQDAGLDGL